MFKTIKIFELELDTLSTSLLEPNNTGHERYVFVLPLTEIEPIMLAMIDSLTIDHGAM